MGRRLHLHVDPCEMDPTEIDESFKLYSFNRKHRSFKHPKEVLGDEEIVKKLGEGYAWMLDYHEHGCCVWGLAGTMVGDPWDTSRLAGVLVHTGDAFNLSPDRKIRDKTAAGYLRDYTNWANGCCFMFRLEDEEGATVDAFGGLIGTDSLVSGINESLEEDDVIVIHSNEFVPGSEKLKCRVVRSFAELPPPEYAI